MLALLTANPTEPVSETTAELGDMLTSEAEHVSGIFTGLWNAIKSVLPSLGFAAVTLICALMVIKILMKFIRRAIDRSNVNPTAATFVQSLIQVLLYVIAAVIVLSILKVPTTSIVTLIGAAGLALSLAVQDSLANVAGGFIIMFTKPMQVGDLVKFGDVMGTVESIGILQTRLVLPDKTVVFIPNGQVSASMIVNYSEQELRRLDLDIGIGYADDFEAAKQVIAGLIAQSDHAVTEPAPVVRLGAFGDSAVILHVRVWSTNEHYWDLHYELHEGIKKAFDEAGISIPFPQMDVHFPGEKPAPQKKIKKIEKNA